jgi:hypothetical protein
VLLLYLQKVPTKFEMGKKNAKFNNGSVGKIAEEVQTKKFVG